MLPLTMLLLLHRRAAADGSRQQPAYATGPEGRLPTPGLHA
jgi:hypothetical protein